MRRFAVRIAVLALSTVPLLASPAAAQGYGVYEHDACVMARAGTGVAAPCSASAIFFNPAGIVNPSSATRWNLSIGATSIGADFAFRDSVNGQTTNSTGSAVMVPNAHITMQYKNRYAFGIGVFAPYGLVSEWPTAGFAGRFLGYRSELKSIYIQPTFAWQIRPWLQVGAGFDYIRTSVDLKQRVDLSSQQASATATFGQLGIPAGTDFADAHLEGNSWSSGAHFGILLKPTDRVSIGARYLSRARADIQGTASFTQIFTGIILPPGNPIAPANTPLDSVLAPQFRGTAALTQQHVSTFVPLPDQIVVGVAIQMSRSLNVLADFQWVNWSKFSKLPLTFERLPARTLWEDYRDTHAVRLGAEYTVTPKLTVRGGLLYHEGAAPVQTVTPLLPEAERAEQTVGLGYQLRPNMRLDVAYQHINQADRRGRILDAPRFSTANNTGIYTGSANLFGASLAWGF